MPEVLKIDPLSPCGSVIAEAVNILKGGGVIAYPTETFYGLGVDCRDEKAIKKIFSIKGRSIKNPLSVIIGDICYLREHVEEIPEIAICLTEKFWPGALTILFKANQTVSSLLTAGTGKIGIRISSHPIATALARALCYPITATSANISGAGECTSAHEVIERIGERIDAVIDGGPTQGGSGSTIVDITTYPPVILREGIIPNSLILTIFENR